MAISEFRADINALRATAVAGVVLYHFHVPGFSGGFVGVDVFFVISGFLMTSIIQRRIENGRFSVLDFYTARVRRIIPALVVMILSLLVFSACFVDPMSLASTARSAISSALFVSNIDYFFTQNYFALPAEGNWLLHTWSLSLEWQFYLIYPVIFATLAKLLKSPSSVRTSLWVATLLSLGLALAVARWGNGMVVRSSFYLLPARAWEMLAGGLVALHAAPRLPDRWRSALSWAGFISILACFAFVVSGRAWPSAWTLLPVAGTVLVLWARAKDGPISALPPIKLLGLGSYSIYLWHWPIVVASRYFGWGDTAWAVALAIGLSVFAGLISYALVETRLVQTLFERGKARGVGLVLTSVAISVAIAGAAKATEGFEQLRIRGLPGAVKASLADLQAASTSPTGEEMCDRRRVIEGGVKICSIGGSGAGKTLVLGDSHAAQLIMRYKARSSEAGREIVFASRFGCALIPGVERNDGAYGCAAATDAALKEAATGGYDRVVVASSWAPTFGTKNADGTVGRVCFPQGQACVAPQDHAEYQQLANAAFIRLGARLKALSDRGAQVFLVTAFPASERADPTVVYRKTIRSGSLQSLGLPRAQWDHEDAISRHGLQLAAKEANGTLVDATAALCDATSCPMVQNGTTAFRDAGHFRDSSLKSERFSFLDPAVLGGK